METVRNGAARVGTAACTVNRAVQTRFSKIFFPFNDRDIPPKLRKQAWAFRITYIVWTMGQTLMIFWTPNTYLKHQNGDINPHAAWTFLLMLLISWFFYFQVQASNPGYITAPMLHRFNTKHAVFGVGDNGEGDSFSMSVFRTVTNLGRRAVTSIQSAASTEAKSVDAGDDLSDSSSSGEEDDEPVQIATPTRTPANDDDDADEAPTEAAEIQIQVHDDDASADSDDQEAQEPKKSAKTLQAESMARVERYLAGQDKKKPRRAKKNGKKPKHKKTKNAYSEATTTPKDETELAHGSEEDDDVPNMYAESKFVRENDEFGLDDVEDGTFQTRMDFEDIKDDFPLRARYCRQADRVVPKFDHYCDMLGTPIGERNHALFWMFLASQSVVLVHAVSIAASGFTGITGNLFWDPASYAESNALVAINMVTLGIPTIGVVSLLIFHTWCAITDTLTYEFLKNSDLDYLKPFGPCDLPFSKGQCRNFYRFLVVQPGWCISTNDWLPTKYAPPEQFYRDSTNCCMNPWENKYYRCC